MKILACELKDKALDYAVALCLGGVNLRFDSVACYWITIDGKDRALSTGWSPSQSFSPSTLWEQGGPIIERERLQITSERGGTWVASSPYAVEVGGYRKYCFNSGPTPLIAAMRCYVASKLGAEVEIPDELA